MSYTCGTGAWSGPLPGDPSTNSILTATPVFGGIDITWTPAIVNPHAVAHTYLYRSTNPDFLTAIRIATVGGTHFYDKLENLLTYYYWIQIVSINGTLGEVIGPASAIPRLSIDATIEALTGRIDNGVLAQSLKSEIDRISLIDGDLFQEIQDRIAANELLGAAIQTAQTDASQAVSLLNEEITQRTTAYNVLLQTLNTMAGQVNDNKAAIETETTLRISNDEALAQQITNVQSAAGDNLAAVQTTLQTNINTVNGKVTDIGALYTAKVQVNGLIGGFGVYNDGTEVQAGFDVDTFWVGRTGPDKKKPFIIDSNTGETYIDKAVIPTLTADMIDTRNLTIKDENGVVLFGAGKDLDWGRIEGSDKPQDGATRNVFKGNWTTGSNYYVGDILMKDGNGWSCILPHTSSSGNAPPSSGSGNTWWALYTVKGDPGAPGDSVDIIFRRSASQPATPAASAGVPANWYSDTNSVPAGSDPMWSCVGTKASDATNYTWQTPIKIEGSDGASGTNGMSIAELTIFRRGSSAPATPTGGTYNFATKTLTPPSGWSVAIPTGTDPVYACRSVVSSTDPSAASVAPGTWSTPVVSFQNGAPGEPGAAGDSVDIIFQRAASQPATPAASAGVPSGWYSDIGSVPASGNPMWSCVGTKASGASNYTWQLPLKIEGSNGTSGSNGLSIAELTVFSRSASAPATPTGGTYNFSTKTLTPPSGWSVAIPTGTDPVYASRSVVSSTDPAATSVAPGTWSSPVVSFQNGAQGPQGTQGPQGIQGPQGSQGLQGPAGPAGVGLNTSTVLSVATSGTVYVPGIRAGNLTWDGSGNITGGSGTAITPTGLIMASATSGARMMMNQRAIKVFDASGTLRVQLGDLTA